MVPITLPYWSPLRYTRRLSAAHRIAAIALTALFLGGVVAVGGCPEASAPRKVSDAFPEVNHARIDQWRDHIKPHGVELAWEQVGWRSNIWDAILEAHETGKPLLIWSMNGHPKGFT
jgi:hypothetical protein